MIHPCRLCKLGDDCVGEDHCVDYAVWKDGGVAVRSSKVVGSCSEKQTNLNVSRPQSRYPFECNICGCITGENALCSGCWSESRVHASVQSMKEFHEEAPDNEVFFVVAE
ncbi:hypothetical protein LCGC14_1092020 [marine sediment metagenome]|uniref:Uncharacterized protein n=1 Tax=marine sediment metagenome TaxID=412755 RepID=A0A0F9QI43_9ZZZZ